MSWRFYHANEFFQQVIATRNIWLAGRLGSGKTALAVMMADELLRLGVCQYVWSNFPLRVDRWPPPTDGFLQHCVVIVDEAHELINARDFQTNSRQFGAYGRKFWNIWLYPSVDAPDKRVRTIRVQRRFKLDFLPTHIWVYGYSMSYGEEYDLGWFAVLSCESVFGLYDNIYVPFSDSGILDAFQRTLDERKGEQGGDWDPYDGGVWDGKTR
jgi:hypothetical protein